VASQVRTCQQSELARVNLRRLRAATDVLMIEPVPYEKVRGVGFYRQFLNPSEWPDFMRWGRAETRRALHAHRPRRPERAAAYGAGGTRGAHTVPKTLASS
jgi:NTE family protein